MIHVTAVIARRWFQKSNGNTYHTAELILDNGTTIKSPRAYGYADQWRETAKRLACRHAVSLDVDAVQAATVLDVKRQKDL